MRGGGYAGVLPVLQVPDNKADAVPCERLPIFFSANLWVKGRANPSSTFCTNVPLYDIELINWDWTTVQTWEVPLPCDGQGGEDWSCECETDECGICSCDLSLSPTIECAGYTNGGIERGGEPMVGWHVELDGEGGSFTSNPSDWDGWFCFSDSSIPGGTYTVFLYNDMDDLDSTYYDVELICEDSWYNEYVAEENPNLYLWSESWMEDGWEFILWFYEGPL